MTSPLAAVARRVKAISDAHLPHSCVVQAWTPVRQPGGTYVTTWVTEQSGLPCRLATVGTPAERLASGSFAEVKEFRVTFATGVTVPVANRRLVITHDVSGLGSPLTLYPTGSPAHSYTAMNVVLATTEGGV